MHQGRWDWRGCHLGYSAASPGPTEAQFSKAAPPYLQIPAVLARSWQEGSFLRAGYGGDCAVHAVPGSLSRRCDCVPFRRPRLFRLVHGWPELAVLPPQRQLAGFAKGAGEWLISPLRRVQWYLFVLRCGGGLMNQPKPGKRWTRFFRRVSAEGWCMKPFRTTAGEESNFSWEMSSRAAPLPRGKGSVPRELPPYPNASQSSSGSLKGESGR